MNDQFRIMQNSIYQFNKSETMKNKIFFLIIFGIAVCFSSTLKAQTIPITTAGFSYVLTDPRFVQNVDYYDVWIFLDDPSINYWASYTEHIA